MSDFVFKILNVSFIVFMKTAAVKGCPAGYVFPL